MNDQKQNWLGIGIILIVVVAIGYFIFHSSSNNNTPLTIPDNNAVISPTTQPEAGVLDYTEAPSHVGEYASVRGLVVQVFTSNKGTTFFNYCSNYKGCPFSAVIFNSNTGSFNNLSGYQGHYVTIKGLIKTYQGSAEIILNSPDQITKVE